MEEYAKEQGLTIVDFAKGEDKDDKTKAYLVTAERPVEGETHEVWGFLPRFTGQKSPNLMGPPFPWKGGGGWETAW